MSTARSRQNKWRPKFLEALSQTGNVVHACRTSAVSRQAAYDARNRDAAFAEQWDDAVDEAVDMMEMAALKRAVHGVKKTKIVKLGVNRKTGEPVIREITEIEYSDQLLMFLLRGHRPDRFRENFDLNKMVADVASVQEPAHPGRPKIATAPKPKRSA